MPGGERTARALLHFAAGGVALCVPSHPHPRMDPTELPRRAIICGEMATQCDVRQCDARLADGACLRRVHDRL